VRRPLTCVEILAQIERDHPEIREAVAVILHDLHARLYPAPVGVKRRVISTPESKRRVMKSA
jgi:hypothetical protein